MITKKIIQIETKSQEIIVAYTVSDKGNCHGYMTKQRPYEKFCKLVMLWS